MSRTRSADARAARRPGKIRLVRAVRTGPVSPRAPGSGAGLDDPSLFVNRELALLAFQWRVLEEARDPANPLLERVRFLSIVASNLDEFFMVRVGGLKEQIAAGVTDLPPDGLRPPDQLAAVRVEAQRLFAEMDAALRGELIPALASTGIRILDWRDLGPRERSAIRREFARNVFPVLTPLAYDPGRPFPHISNMSLNLAILVKEAGGRERFARLKLPDTLPRLLPFRTPRTPAREHRFVWIEQAIAANLDELFPGLSVVSAHAFHLTRHADLAIRELEADDLLETIEQGVRRRRFRSVTSLTIGPRMPDRMRGILEDNLELREEDVYVVEGPLALSRLRSLCDLSRPELKYTPFLPAVPKPLRHAKFASTFAAIRRGGLLLHHPYDSFAPVVNFLADAVHDRRVLAIKQTLYRVGSDSPVVGLLLTATTKKKEVTALVELKARFDEESNIEWARALEREGVHVIYGLVGLKTHCKVLLVVRKEGGRIVRYVHLGTGNYNPVTATQYTDFGFFTCDPDIGADATELFNYLTGYSRKTAYRKLLVAPLQMRRRLEELIRGEIEHRRAGRPAELVFQMNSLVDRRMIQLLYEASRAGVRVDLVVRGMCCLRPGVPGVSENIRVRSIVGRFLEHSRIFYFRNGGDERVYLGSADLMPRNLGGRVEVLFPVEDARLVRRLRDEVLETALRDNRRARRMRPDGTYERVRPAEGEEPVDCQAFFLARAARREGS